MTLTAPTEIWIILADTVSYASCARKVEINSCEPPLPLLSLNDRCSRFNNLAPTTGDQTHSISHASNEQKLQYPSILSWADSTLANCHLAAAPSSLKPLSLSLVRVQHRPLVLWSDIRCKLVLPTWLFEAPGSTRCTLHDKNSAFWIRSRLSSHYQPTVQGLHKPRSSYVSTSLQRIEPSASQTIQLPRP